MTSNKYWQERARLDKIKVIKTGEQGVNNLKRLLKLNLDDVEKKIKAFYDKYGENPAESLSYTEFQRYKAQLRAKAKKFPKDKTLQKLAKQDIPKYKIDRLRALQTDLQMQLTEATAGQEKGIYKTLDDVAKVSQATTAARFKGALGLEFNTITDRKMKQILSSDWSGATWSERLWKDREKVGQKLTEILETGIPQGKSLQSMARELKNVTGQSFNNAARLIRTEASYIDGSVAIKYLQDAKEKGYTRFIFDAFLDNRTSKICREMDGKKFNIDDAQIGVNVNPLHPNCRSHVIVDLSSYNDDDVDLWQEGKNPDKNRKEINKFVDGVVSGKLEPKVNDINIGEITPNVRNFLKKQGIKLENNNVKLTYGRVEHALRTNKNPLQKVTEEQLKRVGFAIQKNNVYFDTVKNNLVYIVELPPQEVVNGRNIIKVPVNVKQYNSVATVSIVPDISILNDKRYKKID